jgi:hypothetical protein
MDKSGIFLSNFRRVGFDQAADRLFERKFVRRASRALTLLYDRALRPLGLRATQFTILQVLSRAGPHA